MTEVYAFSIQYDRAMNGDAWHGDHVWKILDESRPEEAFHRILPETHSIWELVAHMTFWETQVARRLRREPDLPGEELNFPPMPEATAENWKSAGPVSSVERGISFGVMQRSKIRSSTNRCRRRKNRFTLRCME